MGKAKYKYKKEEIRLFTCEPSTHFVFQKTHCGDTRLRGGGPGVKEVTETRRHNPAQTRKVRRQGPLGSCSACSHCFLRSSFLWCLRKGKTCRCWASESDTWEAKAMTCSSISWGHGRGLGFNFLTRLCHERRALHSPGCLSAARRAWPWERSHGPPKAPLLAQWSGIYCSRINSIYLQVPFKSISF